MERPSQNQRERRLVDAEIVWNKRFFRPGIWRADFYGGKDFAIWNSAQSDPVQVLDLCRPLLGKWGDIYLIAGHDAAAALRKIRLPKWIEAMVICSATFTGAPWAPGIEWAANPSNALLLSTRRGDRHTKEEASRYGSAYMMATRDQGVLMVGCVR